MCKVGKDFILCRCAGESITKSKPYWQLFSLVKTVESKAAPELAVHSAVSDNDPLSLADYFDASDDIEMEVGDIVVPAIMDSPTYQDFLDTLNSRQCFDVPIDHHNMDTLIIYLKGDEYHYQFFDHQWQSIGLNLNEPQRQLSHSGEAKGVDHLPPFVEDKGEFVGDWLWE